MSDVRGPFEIEARKLGFDATDHPRRLLLVPELGTLANVMIFAGVPGASRIEWELQLIKEVMEWSDLFSSTGEWSRMVVATPGFRPYIYDTACEEAWQSWITYVNRTESLSWQNINYHTGTFGDKDAKLSASAIYYTMEHFNDLGSFRDGWSDILFKTFPGCSVEWSLDDESVVDLFAAGRVRRHASCTESAEEVVIPYRMMVDGKIVLRARAFTVPVR